MEYRIDCLDNEFGYYAYGRKDLLSAIWSLTVTLNEEIVDIRKVTRKGIGDSVMKKYKKHINDIRR